MLARQCRGLGGFTFVNRLSLTTLQPTGIGFQRGWHANWQIVHNSGSGSPTLINLGSAFPVDSATNVLTLFLYSAANAGSVWVRVVEEVSGAIAEVELTANLPAATSS